MARRFNPRAGGQTKGCAPCTPHSGSRTPTYRDAELKPRPGPGAPIPSGPLSRASGLSPSAGTGAGAGVAKPGGHQESGRTAQSGGAGRPGGECPQPAPPLAPRLRLASPWWSRETRRRYCAGPRAPRSLCRRTPRCRREDGLEAAVGAAERPRKRPEGGNPTSQHPPKCCCSPGVWSWATWRRTRWWLCSWSPSIPARVRDA